MKKVLLFLCIWLLSTSYIFSQHRADNWVFNTFGLKFNNDTVEVLDYYVSGYSRAMGAISDFEGNLLFYSDGITIFNKNKNIMYNGHDICQNGSEAVHQSIIIPKPSSGSLYYVFSLEPGIYAETSGLYYSVVDMSLDNGLGRVTQKGIKIQDSLTNKLTAVYHENYQDVWLMTNTWESNKFNSLLITDDGPSNTTVISVGGMIPRFFNGGMLSASPDGTKIVCSYDNWMGGEGFDLFEFNSATGELTNPFIFKTIMRGCNSSEFSSDATKLYIYQNGSTGEATLFQYDLSDYVHDKIDSSRVELIKPEDNIFEEMQLAPNGKIYISKGGGQSSGTQYLGVINEPNLSNHKCDVKELGLWLEGSSAMMFTPNFIQNSFFKTDFEASNLCLGDTTSFQITNLHRLDSVKWDFGDLNFSANLYPKHLYANSQNYTVKLICYYPEKNDTIYKEIYVNSSPIFSLGDDKTICGDSEIELSADKQFEDCLYLWSNNTSNQTIPVGTPGNYWLQITSLHDCIYTDSININTIDLPDVNLGNDITIDKNSTIVVDAGDFGQPTQYLWDNNSTERYRHFDGELLNDGDNTIFVDVIAPTGCANSDTINITVMPIVLEEENGCMCQFFPNPSYDVLTIENNSKIPRIIKIYNSVGQLMLKENLNLDYHFIDVTHFNAAIYFIQIYETNNLKCKYKLMVK